MYIVFSFRRYIVVKLRIDKILFSVQFSIAILVINVVDSGIKRKMNIINLIFSIDFCFIICFRSWWSSHFRLGLQSHDNFLRDWNVHEDTDHWIKEGFLGWLEHVIRFLRINSLLDLK